MSFKKFVVGFFLSIGLLGILVTDSCTKNATPAPPIHDTTIVTKTDTLVVAPPKDTTINLRKGLLLWLPFDGNIADSSGNKNQTTAINGASLTYDEHGYANNAFGANGSGQVIVVTNNGSIKFDTAYSVSVNFMTLDTSVRRMYVSMIDWSNGQGSIFSLGNSQPSTPGIFHADANDIAAGCDNAINNPNKIDDTTAFHPLTQSWYNAILIYHRGTIQVYINGQLTSTKTGTGTLANACTSSNIVVGGWWSGDPVNVNGKVDDIRLYDRVLTPHEIALLAKRFQNYP